MTRDKQGYFTSWMDPTHLGSSTGAAPARCPSRGAPTIAWRRDKKDDGVAVAGRRIAALSRAEGPLSQTAGGRDLQRDLPGWPSRWVRMPPEASVNKNPQNRFTRSWGLFCALLRPAVSCPPDSPAGFTKAVLYR